LRLTVTLGEFWYQQGLYQEGAHWLELALAQSDIPDQLCAQLLTYLGMIRRASGDYLSATDYFQKSLQIFQHLEEEAQMARVLEEMTDVVLLQADYEQADQLAMQSLTLYRQVGNQQAALSIMLRLAAAAVEQRQAERAKPLLAQCLAMSHELNLPGSLATVLNVFGMFELEQGQAHESLPRFEDSLHLFQKLDHRLNIAWTLRNLGLANLFCGQIKAAISYFQQGLALYQELDCEDGAATILEGIAGVALVMNHPNCAARLFGASAAIRATVGMPITPNSQAIYERMLAAGPATMGSAAWATMLDQGRSLSFAQAVADALALFQTPEDG
jgi:Tfp pilus assembly protein PilF